MGQRKGVAHVGPVIRVVEQKAVDMEALRARMRENSVSVKQLAEVTGWSRGDTGSILSGHAYLGPKRRARLIAAVQELGLDRWDENESA
jgi:hypothetical protein